MREWIPNKPICDWTEAEKGQYISLTMDYMLYLEQLLQETKKVLDTVNLTTSDVEFLKLTKAYSDCIVAKAEYDS